jgi:hypothetical protein
MATSPADGLLFALGRRNMASVKWFKVGEHVQGARVDPQGRVNISQLAAEYGLDLTMIKLNGILESADSQGWTLGPVEGGDRQEAPIIVTGRPAAGESSRVYSTGSSFCRVGCSLSVSWPLCRRGCMRLGLVLGGFC